MIRQRYTVQVDNTRCLALGDWGQQIKNEKQRQELEANYSSSAACSSRTLYPAAPPRCQHCRRYSLPRMAVSIFQGKSGPQRLFPCRPSSLGALCRIGPWRLFAHVPFFPLSSAQRLSLASQTVAATKWAAPASAAQAIIVTECQGVPWRCRCA